MLRPTLALLLAALSSIAAGFDQPPPKPKIGPDEPGVVHGSMSFGGMPRTWSRFTPRKHDARKPCAMLIALHGGLGKGESMSTITEHGFEHWLDQHDQDGVIVYPDGIDGNWDDDRVGVDSTAHQRQVDDVGFIRQLIERVATDTVIDRQRIYVTGISNGAMMCYRLARELPGTFAAIAPVAGLLPAEALGKTWPQPVSMLLIEGSRDPLMPYEGGVVGSERTPRGTVSSAVETVRFVVAQDNLPEKPQALGAPSAQDGTTWRGELYGPPDGGITVAFFEVQDGGHAWPGGREYAPERIIGRTSRVDACELIWTFLLKHPKP
jgi:polyhydroxybutyrate depolymerase